MKNSKIETDRGILVNRYLKTNIEGVYAIGDCAQQREPIGNRPPVEAVWYTGRMMGEALAQTICEKPFQPVTAKEDHELSLISDDDSED